MLTLPYLDKGTGVTPCSFCITCTAVLGWLHAHFAIPGQWYWGDLMGLLTLKNPASNTFSSGTSWLVLLLPSALRCFIWALNSANLDFTAGFSFLLPPPAAFWNGYCYCVIIKIIIGNLECFRNLNMHYILKKNIQCTNTHNYTNK